MGLNVKSEMAGETAKIWLEGDVDSATASQFMKEVDKFASKSPKKLALFMEDLKFMSSAGLRVLIFAKQKLGAEVSIYLIKPQEQIVDSLEKTGFHLSVHIVDNFED
jgi:anti-anti-sigma factor